MQVDKKSDACRHLPRIGHQMPAFSGTIVTHDNRFADFSLRDVRKKYVVLVFFPLAFTFVCPTELIAINNRLPDFDARGAEVIAISIDSQHALLQWKNTPTHLGGIGDVQYPLFSDITHKVSEAYGMMYSEDYEGSESEEGISPRGQVVPLRGTFISDRDSILHHYSVNNLGIGRNFDEALRVIDAIQHYEKHGEVCPAGWVKGKEAMRATRDGVSDYLTSNAERL